MPAIGVNLRVTGHCSQGDRKYMEDMFAVAYQERGVQEVEYAFCGIFDGHGGPEAAVYAKDHLLDAVLSQRNFWSGNDEDVLRAIHDGFIETHYTMWRDIDKWPKTSQGLPSTSGTTASVAFIRNSKIYIGHVGDTCIVLGIQDEGESEWRAEALTRDHKPEDHEEMTRIQKAGGKVLMKSGVHRVVWNRPQIGHQGPVRRSTPIDEIPFLAVARSLGDFWSYNSQLNTFVVSPEPDVSVLTVDLRRHKCLIFGTDGLWNILSPANAVSLVQRTENHNGRQQLRSNWLNPSKCLVDRAIQRWSVSNSRADNTSVVVLLLDPPAPPDTEVLYNRGRRLTYLTAHSRLPRERASTLTLNDHIPLSHQSGRFAIFTHSPVGNFYDTVSSAACTVYHEDDIKDNVDNDDDEDDYDYMNEYQDTEESSDFEKNTYSNDEQPFTNRYLFPNNPTSTFSEESNSNIFEPFQNHQPSSSSMSTLDEHSSHLSSQLTSRISSNGSLNCLNPGPVPLLLQSDDTLIKNYNGTNRTSPSNFINNPVHQLVSSVVDEIFETSPMYTRKRTSESGNVEESGSSDVENQSAFVDSKKRRLSLDKKTNKPSWQKPVSTSVKINGYKAKHTIDETKRMLRSNTSAAAMRVKTLRSRNVDLHSTYVKRENVIKIPSSKRESLNPTSNDLITREMDPKSIKGNQLNRKSVSKKVTTRWPQQAEPKHLKSTRSQTLRNLAK
ncbi:protein phosphatase 2C isoform X2 [Lycorma delicatula]|uniref:protein phosphatase 2C isoform X2 n=1 Tax=Lycorma delicatula TaxID=130591 RepID=UPI003F50ED35